MSTDIIVTYEGSASGALNRHFGKAVRLDKRPSGAPYIKGDDHFVSLSHKDGRMVIAVSDCPVGIDIERIVEKQAYYRIADAYFAEKVAEGDIESFFRGWTRREAFAKMLGKGLDGDVMRMDMSADSFEYQQQTVYFIEKRIDDYMITVAGYYPDGQVEIVGGKEDEE